MSSDGDFNPNHLTRYAFRARSAVKRRHAENSKEELSSKDELSSTGDSHVNKRARTPIASTPSHPPTALRVRIIPPMAPPPPPSILSQLPLPLSLPPSPSPPAPSTTLEPVPPASSHLLPTTSTPARLSQAVLIEDDDNLPVTKLPKISLVEKLKTIAPLMARVGKHIDTEEMFTKRYKSIQYRLSRDMYYWMLGQNREWPAEWNVFNVEKARRTGDEYKIYLALKAKFECSSSSEDDDEEEEDDFVSDELRTSAVNTPSPHLMNEVLAPLGIKVHIPHRSSPSTASKALLTNKEISSTGIMTEHGLARLLEHKKMQPQQPREKKAEKKEKR